jgi:hypothetical protein
MIALHCTTKVLKRFRLDPVPEYPAPTTVLGNWYANLLNVGSQRHVLCLSERTFLPVILPARKSEFPSEIGAYLEPVLVALGVPQEQVRTEIQAVADYSIAKTQSRQVLGVMNDFAFIASHHLLHESQLETALRLAGTPSRPLAYSFPHIETCRAFGVARL